MTYGTVEPVALRLILHHSTLCLELTDDLNLKDNAKEFITKHDERKKYFGNFSDWLSKGFLKFILKMMEAIVHSSQD